MNKTIQTDKAPMAIGPYSQGVVSGDLLFVSGQLAIDPDNGKIIEGSIAERTERILHNLESIAREAGTTLDQVVKTTIFLTDLSQFSEVNEAYGRFFKESPPARSTVQVAALPLNADIEIEAIIQMS